MRRTAVPTNAYSIGGGKKMMDDSSLISTVARWWRAPDDPNLGARAAALERGQERTPGVPLRTAQDKAIRHTT